MPGIGVDDTSAGAKKRQSHATRCSLAVGGLAATIERAADKASALCTQGVVRDS